MACKTLSMLIILLFTILFCSSLVTAGSSYYKEISPSKFKFGPQKATYIQFYLHEFLLNSNATDTEVTVALDTASLARYKVPFSLTAVYDYLLTEGKSTKTKQVGKAQGILSVSSQTENSVTMAFNFLFTQGKFNGSTLAVLGRDNLDLKEREMPIVGGTGKFRFAKGYMKTTTIYASTNYSLFHYNLYVYHF